MIKKNSFFFLFLLFFFTIRISNAQVGIRGKITDSLDTGIPYVPLAIISSADSAVVKGAVTDDSGFYIIDNTVKPGRYLLKIVATGFRVEYSPVFDLDSLSSVTIPDIRLSVGAVNLNMVSVSAIQNTVDFKNGNIIINVENSPLAFGNSVFDLLKRMPGVNIDNENKISIQGRSGVKVLIDDRMQQVSDDQLVNLLKGMSANSVSKIEILKNPPVKYDASGTAGLINIVSKKVKVVGFKGDINIAGSQGFYSGMRGGVSLNYKAKKASFYASINGNSGLSRSSLKWSRNFDFDTIKSSLEQNSVTRYHEQAIVVKAGADFFINSKNTIGFSVDGNSGMETPYESGTMKIVNDSSQGFKILEYSSVNPDSWTSISYNINAEHKFDTLGTTISFSSDYNTYTENASGDFYNYYFNEDNVQSLLPYIYRSKNDISLNIGSSRLDFKKNIGKSADMETGIKGSFINQTSAYVFENRNNTSNEYIIDTLYTNEFSYEEQNLAGYFTFHKALEKLDLQLGLRGEYTMLQGHNQTSNYGFSRDYFQLFPNLSLEYNYSETHNWQFTYNRRIDRPGFSNLNPFKWYSNQYTSGQGNPLLKPEISNTLELTHSYNSVIYNSFSYSHVTNYILFYTSQNNETKETIQTVGNIKGNDTYGYNLFIEKDLISWLSLSLNGSASYFYYNGVIDGKILKSGGLYYSAFANAIILLPAKTKFEVSGNYSGPMVYGIGSTKSNWYVNLAVKKSFFHDKLNVSVGVNDLFHTNINRNQIRFENQDWTLVQISDTRRLKVAVSYSFGKIKAVGRDKNVSNEEEKDRLKH
jgi:outer membrane receptor protein involved in Fe transport